MKASVGEGPSLTEYAAERPRAALVLAHGAGADQTHAFMVAFARGLAERGVHTFTFDFPYMEQGRRMPDRAPVLEERFRAVLARVRTATTSPLFIGGKSMGGRIASHLAAAHEDVAGLVCFGYPLHPPGKPEALRVHHLEEIRVPFLVVQGSRDTFGSPEELRPHLEKIPAEVVLHVVEEGDHSFKAPRRRGTAAEIYAQVLDVVAGWMESVIAR